MAPLAGLSGKKHDVAPIIIRDADVIVAALRQELADATPEERPGLERAVALAEATATATESELRARWVHSRLASVGFTGAIDSVPAVKALRQAEPKLSLLAAAELQKDAVQHPQ
ncbi:hypothetical protein [Streptomyces catenulae]|uniref:Uncharacterized protein n=1 Tax=Streptomyces catenulae TaxID=66875 RepID=A0ABV2Z5Q5_9ACTN|nr:hypothetical protein [Streptomyces catenulae]